MGRPKGSKNKQKSGRVQVKAVKAGRRGRPAGSVNVRRAETSGYVQEEQSAVETVAQLTIADRILRMEQGLVQLNGYVQNVVNNINAYINSNPPAPAQQQVASEQAVYEKAKSNGSHAAAVAAVAAAPEAAVKEVKRGRPAKAAVKTAVKAAPVEVTTEDDITYTEDFDEDDFEEEDLSDDFEEDESVI